MRIALYCAAHCVADDCSSQMTHIYEAVEKKNPGNNRLRQFAEWHHGWMGVVPALHSASFSLFPRSHLHHFSIAVYEAVSLPDVFAEALHHQPQVSS
jgi:hypothetical protein